MPKLTIHVVYSNQEVLDRIGDRSHIRKVRLDLLPIGKYQVNELAETRFLLSDIPLDSEYIGFSSARWNEKYPDNVPLEELDQLPLAPDVVWVGFPALACWAAFSEDVHPGMLPYLQELHAVSGLPALTGHSFWSNNFICHRQVFADFLAKWRAMFDAMYARHGCNFKFGNNYARSKLYIPALHPAYFYERLTVLYFANRTDLRMMLASRVNLDLIKAAGLERLKRVPYERHVTQSDRAK